jgi:P-type conjugative transfer protein TrbJ
LLALALWLGGSVPARAQFGGTQIVFDPTIFGRQAAQLGQEELIAKLLGRNTLGGGAGYWRPGLPFLQSLGAAMGRGGGVCYANGDALQQFAADFPGMTPPTVNAAARARQLTAATLATLSGALASAQMQAGHFNYENEQLDALEARNQAAVGALQALQVTNEILLAQVQQAQLTRQLLITLINEQSVYQANELNLKAQAAAQAGVFLSAGAATP